MKSHDDYVSKNTETYDVMLKFFSHEFSDSDQSKYERNCLDEFLLRLDRSSNVLDMACGVGKLSGYINKKGFDVEGCDLSKVLLDSARVNNPHINFIQDDIRNYFPQKKFNAVVLSYCLFHFTEEDIKRILNNIYIFTSDHAVVHIVVYIGDGYEGFIKDPINEDEDIKKLVDNERNGRPFETYVNLMSEEQFCDLIKACNYEIVAKHVYHCEKGIGFSDRILFLDIMRKG